MKKRLFVAVAAVAAVAVAGGAYAWATGAGGGAVAACAQKVNGQLRLDNGTGCRPSEDAVALAAAGTGAVPMYAHVDGGALDVSRSSGVISMAYRVVTIGPAEIGVYCFDLVSPASNVSAVGALGPASAAGIGFSSGSKPQASQGRPDSMRSAVRAAPTPRSSPASAVSRATLRRRARSTRRSSREPSTGLVRRRLAPCRSTSCSRRSRPRACRR